MNEININQNIFEQNEQVAAHNRAWLKERQLTMVNLMASPGAGKTSLILQLLKHLPQGLSAGVIEGDVASSVDADKVTAAGWPVVQINTGGGCHLEAQMVGQALKQLNLSGPGLIIVENIGNLICPVDFNLGESLKLVVTSTPEGDDKPLKYPGIFAAADIIAINKIDLLPHLDFSLEKFSQAVKLLNQQAKLCPVSARSGDGVVSLLSTMLKS
ncbi:hydrogenase accessory protein HypB [candidate division WOR-1 bacterium RIFOXYB2_FULL_48_7]|uniref:Hydrogenase accessory protein HypB n=1 Tax=candidate division WOR-1 bacterium RIFOXYB2_FULL_48_7 TaxID=1802583 RepID=A0A1F4TVW5_UNCSA|nr:MAG: hydrogenase accessory protein HypB [candidate division WOR-1 bacterium RIFOXYB2_FULL_48_7]